MSEQNTEWIYTELLRNAAQQTGLLSLEDEACQDGVISEAAAQAIDALLDQQLRVPPPTEDDGRRYYEATQQQWRVGERVHARHVLLAVTPGVDVQALRKRAEKLLLDLRCAPVERVQDDAFSQAARTFSNCPTGEKGGDLGWLTSEDCAPEFAKELFGQPEVGVLPRLVQSRFGLHVVEVLGREPGKLQSYEQVRGAVAADLTQQASRMALRQYLKVLAGQAGIEGGELGAAESLLVQ
ncbi:MAG: peptidylprolyl isomerase [Burkholderiales bacterium]|nr:peptidylprolyl isomerase [Burkholderiales bacterium]